MPELFDTRQIPDDAEYWDVLGARVAADAARESSANGFDWFARSPVSWLATSLLVAAALVFLMLPAVPPSGIVRTEWAQALAPADEVGQAIILDDKPPAIGALLFAVDEGVR